MLAVFGCLAVIGACAIAGRRYFYPSAPVDAALHTTVNPQKAATPVPTPVSLVLVNNRVDPVKSWRSRITGRVSKKVELGIQFATQHGWIVRWGVHLRVGLMPIATLRIPEPVRRRITPPVLYVVGRFPWIASIVPHPVMISIVIELIRLSHYSGRFQQRLEDNKELAVKELDLAKEKNKVQVAEAQVEIFKQNNASLTIENTTLTVTNNRLVAENKSLKEQVRDFLVTISSNCATFFSQSNPVNPRRNPAGSQEDQHTSSDTQLNKF